MTARLVFVDFGWDSIELAGTGLLEPALTACKERNTSGAVWVGDTLTARVRQTKGGGWIAEYTPEGQSL